LAAVVGGLDVLGSLDVLGTLCMLDVLEMLGSADTPWINAWYALHAIWKSIEGQNMLGSFE
jgi:hypothetical protein